MRTGLQRNGHGAPWHGRPAHERGYKSYLNAILIHHEVVTEYSLGRKPQVCDKIIIPTL